MRARPTSAGGLRLRPERRILATELDAAPVGNPLPNEPETVVVLRCSVCTKWWSVEGARIAIYVDAPPVLTEVPAA